MAAITGDQDTFWLIWSFWGFPLQEFESSMLIKRKTPESAIVFEIYQIEIQILLIIRHEYGMLKIDNISFKLINETISNIPKIVSIIFVDD